MATTTAKQRVVIVGNKRGLPMRCYVGKSGFTTYLADHAYVYRDAKDAEQDLRYFRQTYPTYTFETEPK